MKLITSAVVLLTASIAFSQLTDKRFDNFHGLRHSETGDEFLEAEGHEIFSQLIKFKLDEKGMIKLKKKYGLKEIEPTIDSVLQLKFFKKVETNLGLKANTLIYLIPFSNGNTRVIGFTKVGKIDLDLAHGFIQAYQKDEMPAYVFTSTTIGDVDFAGRTLELGSACHWMGPHNIQCPNYGQMNWAIFNNLLDAKDYLDTRIAMAKNKNLVDIKEEKLVTIEFEGQETQALRTKLKIQIPKVVMAGSNILVVYYVTANVRDKYVSCILSHYTDDVGADTLPPLLNEVMKLK